ncbi:MAG: glycosyltransferase [Acidibacillus sp.]|nr:glycosyltransferase [Acidibacillus sp.]
MKIAIVHDYLNQMGGAERVVSVLHEIFPEASIHTLFYRADKLWPSMKSADIRPSWLQKFPLIEKHFKLFFWLYPFAIRSIAPGDCDVIISSSSAYAKGFRKVRKQSNSKLPVHICYCHSPMRFAWSIDSYIENETNSTVLKFIARFLSSWLRMWDVLTNNSVDIFIANSSVVADRIRNFYHRSSLIIPPPVSVEISHKEESLESVSYYLIVSRLVSYKRLDLAVEACSRSGRRLVVIGTGPDRERLEKMAGDTVSFLGFQSEANVGRYMANCKALLFPGEEDFGITPVETNMLGSPVVAFACGGALDTVIEGITGTFFTEQTCDSLLDALQHFEELEWNEVAIRQSAMRFHRSVFEKSIRDLVAKAVLSVDMGAIEVRSEGKMDMSM